MMELKMTTDLEQVMPKEFEFNFEELKTELSSRLDHYRNLVITPDSIKEGKADRANLNKLREALENRRKDVKKQCLEPYNVFEAKIKELVALIDEPISTIDSQIKAYDEQRRQEKQDEISKLYEQITPNSIRDILPLSRIWNKSWTNVSVSIQSVEDDLRKIIEKVSADLQAIERVAPEYLAAVKLEYFKSLDLGASLKYCDALQAAAEAQKQNQTTENTPSEQKSPESVQTAPAQPNLAEEPTERMWVLRLSLQVTRNQSMALKKFLEDNHISYTRI